jgi:flagellar hook assembly protein FlgD
MIFDAAGLPIGTYNCEFTVNSNFINSTTIPVTMEVISSAGTGEANAGNGFNVFPNPFSDRTELSFYLAETGPVSLEIYDMQGRCVRTLFKDLRTDAGRWTVAWDGADDYGAAVGSGVYTCRLTGSSFAHSVRLVCIR